MVRWEAPAVRTPESKSESATKRKATQGHEAPMAGLDRSIEVDGQVPWAIGGLGGAVIAGWVVETAYFSGLQPEQLVSSALLLGSIIAVASGGALVYGGYVLGRGGLDPDRYRRVAIWCFGGGLAFFGLNAAVLALWVPDSAWVTVSWLRNTLGMGAAVGLLVGFTEARAVETAIEAERSGLRAEHLENRREWLDYLNGLLRHEVLNNAQVITGYTSVLLRDHDFDEEVRERLETVRRQSEDMTRVAEDVRVLLDATSGVDRLRPIELGGVLEDEIADLRASYEGIEVDADLSESVAVEADEMLPRIFSNLLTNAVEHNVDDPARVEVNLATNADTATVRVADDGPGISPSVQESLFERSTRHAGDHGLGLHLVDQLVERYDGELELVETGPEGSVFAVELPQVDADAGEGGGGERTPG